MIKTKMIVVIAVMIFILTGCGTSVTEQEQEITNKTGMNLNGTYDENDLVIDGLESEVAGITVKIPQIEGLENLEIQEKINEDMQMRISQTGEKFSNLNFMEYQVNANFANVISISVYYGSDEAYGQIYFNYNLLDGTKLAFEDLFYEDTDVFEIVRNAFHEALVLSQMSGEISENEYYKTVKAFLEDDDKQFAFTPAKIYLYSNENTASVKMTDIANEISIYTRYLTEESLYENDKVGREAVFTGVSIPEDAFSLMDFGYLQDNCWYDITMIKEYIGDSFPDEHMQKYQAFKEEKIDYFYERIEVYGKEALKNPEDFYIVMIKPVFYLNVDSEWDGEEWIEIYTDTVNVNERITVLKTSKEDFETVYKEKLIEAYRYDYLAMTGGIYLETEDSRIQTEVIDSEKTYNYMTGEEVD